MDSRKGENPGQEGIVGAACLQHPGLRLSGHRALRVHGRMLHGVARGQAQPAAACTRAAGERGGRGPRRAAGEACGYGLHCALQPRSPSAPESRSRCREGAVSDRSGLRNWGFPRWALFPIFSTRVNL